MKLLEEDTGGMFLDISLSNVVLDLPPQEGKTKAKISKWDHS